MFVSQRRIGNFILDDNQKALILDEHCIYLRKQLWDLLELLTIKPGELVSRDALIDQLWKNNCAVGEPGLNQAIYTIRSILKTDHSSSVSIQTIAKRGYRVVVKSQINTQAA